MQQNFLDLPQGLYCPTVGVVNSLGQEVIHDRSLSTGFHFQQSAYLASGQNITVPFEFLKFPSGSEVKVSAIPGGASAGNRCDTSFNFLFIEN